MTTSTWGIILVVAALVAIGLQVRRWRAGRVTTMLFAAGMIARAGFLFLGIIYAADLVYRWRRAPLIGLGIVGIGIALNLVAGIIENVRRSRASYDDEDRTVE
jgi:uncharacterized protein with PQ loop repeat